jgi:endonuclease-3
LKYRTPVELLVAVILSAQSTDAGVNKATPALFRKFQTPQDYANSSPQQIEAYIRTIGLFRNKAKAIHGAMTRIVQEYGGNVPQTMDELLTLRGVARKTANVVLGEAFGLAEGVVVDTHVNRVANRLGLTRQSDPVKIERDLMAMFPREHWTQLSHLLIWHGRYSCKARGALCAEHPLCVEFCSNAKASARARS